MSNNPNKLNEPKNPAKKSPFVRICSTVITTLLWTWLKGATGCKRALKGISSPCWAKMERVRMGYAWALGACKECKKCWPYVFNYGSQPHHTWEFTFIASSLIRKFDFVDFEITKSFSALSLCCALDHAYIFIGGNQIPCSSSCRVE